jgi:translocation and assembly module TamA
MLCIQTTHSQNNLKKCTKTARIFARKAKHPFYRMPRLFRVLTTNERAARCWSVNGAQMKSIFRTTTCVLGLLALPLAAQDIEFFTGDASDGLRDKLRSASLVLSLKSDETTQAQDYVAAARADYRRLLTALYARGFYSGEIAIQVNGREAAGIPPLDAPSQIDSIAISVTPGPEFSFGQTTVGPVPNWTEMPIGFANGSTATTDRVRQAVRTAVTAWKDQGHAKASPGTQQITARHTAQELDVIVAIVPGPRLTFGPLTVSGNEVVRTDRIIAIAGLPTGNVYSATDLARAERRLRETGTFDSVSLVEDENIAAGDVLPITAQISEAKPRRFGFGVEFSSIEGLGASTYWLHRNFFGGAEQFRLGGDISGIGGETGGVDYAITASLKRPAVYGPDTDFTFSSEISRQDEPDFLLDQAAVEATLNRLIREDLEVSGGFGFIATREETDLGTREFTLLTAPLGATLDRRDSLKNAKNGYYIDVDATPFLSIKGADNGARLFSDARAYRSFGTDDQFTLAARSQIGSVLGADALDAPADFLFFSGGGGSVRGQPYNDLGIDTALIGATVRRGGLSFVGAQLETRYGVTDNIGVVGFYDIGFIGETSNPFGEGDWHAGAGLGIRYNIGIGPIRLDIATPTTGDRAGERVEVYIGIGQSF